MNEKDARQLEWEILSPDAKQFSLAREGENERIVVDTENLARGSGGREEGWKEKVGEGRGLIYGNSVARLKAHTAACCEQRGTGVGKNMDETRADPEEIFDLRFRARHEARTALAFAIVLQG